MMAERDQDMEAPIAHICEEDANECQQQFQQGGIKACKDFLRRKVEEWKTVPLNIGIIGNVKAGKSSFINAIRGLTADDEGAAEVGVVETTMKPKAYAHPNNELLKFWDLPGLGTCKFPKENYLEMVGFSKYDFFLIMSSDTFTENDKWLAGEIADRQKQYFFVRTKIHLHIQNDQYDHPRTHDRDRVLTNVRTNIEQNLGDQYQSNRVFLIDNHHRKKYDFEALEVRLIEDFPSMKREALILSMSTFSKEMVQRKVKVLRDGIWATAMLSACVATVPVPGLSIIADLGLVLAQSMIYFRQLGLDQESLKKTATIMKCDVALLSEIVSKDWQRWLTVQGIKDLVFQIPMVAEATLAEEGARYIPLLGSMVAAPVSFMTTYKILNAILSKMEELALAVMEAAIAAGSANADD